MQQMDELSAANWATARSVLVACVPMLADSLPYLGTSSFSFARRSDDTRLTVL